MTSAAATNAHDQAGSVLLTVVLALMVLAAATLMLSELGGVDSAGIDSLNEREALRYVTEAGMAHATWVADQSSCSNYALPVTPFGAHSYSAVMTPAGGSPITIAATGTLANGNTRTVVSSGQNVYQEPIQTTLQPDAADATDSFIDALKPAWNHGNHHTLRIRGGADPRHSLLRFDLASIPVGAKLISAALDLHSESIDGGGQVHVHRLTNGWLEGSGTGQAVGGVTWNERDSGEPWTSAGADYDAAITAVSTVVAPAGSFHQWDVASVVDAWIAGTAPNNGLILVPGDATVNITFQSSDQADAALRPRLVLHYACECGVGGVSGAFAAQPGTAGLDTYLDSKSGNTVVSYGGEPDMLVSATGRTNGLLKFDLSSLPPDAIVSSAQLNLYLEALSGSVPRTVSVHRLDRAWLEGSSSAPNPSTDGATWLTYDSASFWTAAGGDFTSLAAASTLLGPAAGWAAWDVSNLVAEWVTGAAPNHGFLLYAASDTDGAQFTSSDSVNASRRPKLEISYSCPCGVDCTGAGSGGPACEADFEATGKAFDFDWAPGTGEVTGIDFLPESIVVNGTTIPTDGGWIKTDRNKKKFFVTDIAGALLTEFATGTSDPRGVAYIDAGAWAGHLAVADKSDDAIYFMTLDGVIQASFPTAGITTDPYGISFIGATQSNLYIDHLAISSNKDGTGDTIGGIYIVDQSGVLKKSIDVDAHAERPQGVAHLSDTDKLMVADRDGLVSIVDFNGTVTSQYDATAWGFTEMQGVTVHPTSCEHVVIDKLAKTVTGLATGGATATGGSANLLMVVANPNNLSVQEAVKNSTLGLWGYTVTLIDDQASSGEFAAAAAANDVAFVPEDISANKLDSKLANATIGVVTEEVNLADEFGLATTVGWSSAATISIDDNGHYVTAPFAPDSLTILDAPGNLAHVSGLLAPDLRLLASSPGGPTLVTLEAGGTMFNTLATPGRRAQLPWGDSNFELQNLTGDGETLFRRALEWGVQPPPRQCDGDFAANNLAAEFPWGAGTADVQGIDFVPAGLVINSVTVPAGGGWIMNDKNKDRLFVTDIAGNALTDFAMLAFDTKGVTLVDAGQWIHHIAVLDKAAKRVYYLDLDGKIISSFTTGSITTSPVGIDLIGATASVSYDNHLVISADKDSSGDGVGIIFIVDQSGSVAKTIDVDAHAPKPNGVSHLPGTDKLLVTDQDGLVSVIDFDGTLLHQYPAPLFGLTKLNDVVLNPETCDHVIVGDDTTRIAILNDDAGGGAGPSPQYVQSYLPLTATGPSTWTTVDLSLYGVPGNVVAEVAVINADGGKELWGGVRETGSSLDRRLRLHEADGGGVDVVVMHVQVDSTGQLQLYSEDTGKLNFAILGYWTQSVYTEAFATFPAGASGSWQTRDLGGYGVSAGKTAEIAMINNDPGNEWQAGVRSPGSSLARSVSLHEAKDGGREVTTMFAATDSGAPDIEVFAGLDASVDFVLLGHWATPPGTYSAAYADLGTATVKQVWEDMDVSAFGPPGDAILQILPNNSEDGDEAQLGVRRKDSSMVRLLDLHKAKNGGSELASMHVQVDSDSTFQWFDEDTAKNHRFHLVGWWTLN